MTYGPATNGAMMPDAITRH